MSNFPPYKLQRRAWDMAFELRNSFADQMDLESNIRMEVLTMMAPERWSWDECGQALVLWTLTTEVRV